VLAREVFIREALVPGALATRGTFLADNAKLVKEIAELEHKARRQDVLVDPEAMAAFYAERLPANITSLAAFERWREEAQRGDPRILHFTREGLMRHAASSVTEALFPDALEMAGARLPLKYRFAPGHALDGLTLTVPLALLNQLDEARLSWLVPGMIRDKVAWYFKALPKALRNRLVPVPDRVTAFLQATPAGREPLPEAIRGWMKATLGDAPPVEAWDGADLPPYLVVNVRVVDAAGKELGSGRDLAALRAQLGEAAQMTFAATGSAFERKGLRSWDVGDLPESLTLARRGQRVTGYPALVDEGESVSLALLDTREAADAATRAGVVRLIGFALREALARYEKGAAGFAQASVQLRAAIPPERLLADVLAAVRDRAFVGEDTLPRSERAFAEQVKRARTRLPAVAEGAFRLLGAIAAQHHALSQRLAALPPAHGRFAADLRAQRDALVYPGFFAETPWVSLQHLPRYLEGLERRLAKYLERPERDQRHAAQVAELWRRYRERLERNRAAGRHEPALVAYRWLLEELKVSLFAQELRTPFPVSFKRLEKAWADLSR
jgi:ATP-dependent helicase HrpA